MMRSGSSGATLDTTGLAYQPRDVAELGQPLLRREAQDAGNVLQHVGAGSRADIQPDPHLEAQSGEQSGKGFPTRTGVASLDAGDHGLSGAGSPGQGALADADSDSCFPKEIGGGLVGHTL